MFDLYKKRNFSDIFNDTLSFFKLRGKNYFANYFIINGGLLVLLALLIYLISRIYFENIFLSGSNPESQQMLNQYFDSNSGYFIGGAVVVTLLLIVISILNYSFPVVYLNLAEKGKEEPTSKEIGKALKQKLGRILTFSLLSLITFIPLLVILGTLLVLLSMIIIGIPLMVIAIPAFMCWMFLSFYVYLNSGEGYFTAMGKGFSMLLKNFWVHMGATLIISVLLHILQSILSIIPYIVGMFVMLLDTGNSSGNEKLGTLGILMLITFILSTVFSYILGNILMVSQGMIYYSCEEEDKNHSLHSEIDLIGTDIE